MCSTHIHDLPKIQIQHYLSTVLYDGNVDYTQERVFR